MNRPRSAACRRRILGRCQRAPSVLPPKLRHDFGGEPFDVIGTGAANRWGGDGIGDDHVELKAEIEHAAKLLGDHLGGPVEGKGVDHCIREKGDEAARGDEVVGMMKVWPHLLFKFLDVRAIPGEMGGSKSMGEYS